MLEPMFKVLQNAPGSLDVFVWCGETPHALWHSPARITKWRDKPAVIHAGNLDHGTPEDARKQATVLLMCVQLAQDLDAKYPDGVPDVTEYLPE